ncbi:hypothetical protein [Isoptericola halotolerans]|uniref:Uncharacterized protein n=1 Tax=Isoptericola halotolerans TaxID=300560 RepID=A0ABX2AAL8_9MICO|nr:hypothetical protein [Isoptericola halotolerans]NOV98968.1 hypothetical protein [Isoptericola halotolerans]
MATTLGAVPPRARVPPVMTATRDFWHARTDLTCRSVERCDDQGQTRWQG